MGRWSRQIVAAGFLLAGALPAVAAEEGRPLGQVMGMAGLPAPVRDSLNRQASGGHVTTVQKRTDRGRTVYEAEVQSPEGRKLVELAPDGKLLASKPMGPNEP
jgi:hypothetical protein